jgi:DNA-directed RNA polymerase subunit RPC12/RpoP
MATDFLPAVADSSIPSAADHDARPDTNQGVSAEPTVEETEPLYEWQEYPPDSHESYRCQQCGRRWQDSEVYPDPARGAWSCRHCSSTRWVYAPPGRHVWTNVERRRYRTRVWMRFWAGCLMGWLLLGVLFHTVAWNGSDVTAYMSNAERWAASLSVAFAFSLVIWIVAAVVTSSHASKVEQRHGWGPSVSWPFTPTP